MSEPAPFVIRRALAVAAVAALCAAGPRANAQQQQQSQMSNEMRSDYLFRQGEKKFDSGHYAEACADFAESLRLGPKLGTLLNLALCHETTGKHATAWREFYHAAAWAAQNGQKDRHEFAVQHALALETKLPRVLLQLPAGGAIASVEIDGEPIPDQRWYLPIYLDPGEHAVGVSAPGKERQTVKFRVAASATEQLVIVPTLADEAPKPPPPAPAPEPPADPDRGKRMAGYAVLGAGALGLVLGTGFGLAAIGARNDAANHCIGNQCDGAGAPRYEDAQSWATLSTVSFVVGAAAGAVGAYLVLSSRSRVAVTAGPGAVGVGGAF